jgi:hypothetical protein
MAITLDGSNGLVVSGNTNTLSGLTVGKGAGSVATNTALGVSALAANTGAYNTAVGYSAMTTNTSGQLNVALGRIAMELNTTGGNNTALGDGASQANTTGSYNTSVGRQALGSNTTANYNTAVGYQAGYSVTTADANTAVGSQALYTNTGVSNTGIGTEALKYSTTGIANTAVGGRYYGTAYAALNLNTTGSYNIAVGTGALANNTTASYNTAVGYQAGYSATVSAYNTFVGYQAGYAHNLGSAGNGLNTFIGQSAGYSMTGSKNTVIGTYNGNQGGLNLTTASNYIVLSDGDGNPRGFFDNNGKFIIGVSASSADRLLINGPASFGQASDTNVYVGFLGGNNYLNGSGTIRMQVSSGGVQLTSGATSWASASDERLKDIIEPITGAMAKVNTLRTVMGKYKTDAEGTRRPFLIAQDVIAVLPEAVDSLSDPRSGDDTEYMSVRYTDTIPLLVAAIKEQQAIITTLTERITALEGA